MTNIVMLITEVRKIITLAIIVYVFYTIFVPALNILLFAEQITNDAIQTGLDVAETVIETGSAAVETVTETTSSTVETVKGWFW